MNLAVDSTSTGAALRQLQTPVLLGFMLAGIGTSSGPVPASISLVQPLRIEQTNAGASLPDEGSGAAIAELRRVSGFTWDQLSRLFGVTRRSLHFWASGKAMTVENQERLQHLLATVRQIDRGSATANRAVLMAARHDGTVPFDLLAEGQYKRVVSVLGQGSARPTITPPALSAAARAARRPRPTHELVNAAQDERVEKGRLLATKAIRTSRET